VGGWFVQSRSTCWTHRSWGSDKALGQPQSSRGAGSIFGVAPMANMRVHRGRGPMHLSRWGINFPFKGC
jgi:hypothetical protein